MCMHRYYYCVIIIIIIIIIHFVILEGEQGRVQNLLWDLTAPDQPHFQP